MDFLLFSLSEVFPLHRTVCHSRNQNEIDKLKNTIISNSSDMKSVSNILAGEFLVDVQQICSTSADDDVTKLEEYLLRGRGAVLLKVLNTIGVQVNVLVSI